MKILTKILAAFFPLIISGQGFVPVDTLETPVALIELLPEKILTTTVVDFTGDGKEDYICKSEYADNTYNEYWVRSDFQIVKKLKKYARDIDFFWLVNIDADVEPEIFSASGWTEGIDYCFMDQDLNTGTDRILFYFNPVILEGETQYWGYPWDIRDLMLKRDAGNITLYGTFDHDIQRDGEITVPDWQVKFPVICFSGLSTQRNGEIKNIRNLEWMDLTEIIARTRNTPSNKQEVQ